MKKCGSLNKTKTQHEIIDVLTRLEKMKKNRYQSNLNF